MKKLLVTKRRRAPIFKLDLKMKLSILLIWVTFFSLKANDSYAQRANVTLEFNNITVGQLIDEIEIKTEFQFVYKIEDVDLERTVTIKADNKKIDYVLNQIFHGTKTTYNLNDRRIYLVRRKEVPIAKPLKIGDNSPVYQHTIEGSILDREGNPLPGANIVEKGTTNGTQADFDGNFAINVVDENAVLVISYIGFATKEIPLNGQVSIVVNLEDAAAGLDEVVVIGYGAVKKSDLTGSVASIKTDEIETSTAASVGQMLSGRAAGLQIINNSAQPGGAVSFQIRGAASNGDNSPLIVLDGFPLTDNNEPGSGNRYSSGSKSGLNSINPDDIASIEVLKDASSTAIYGARASNGVILITTKRGKQGFKLTYDTSLSTQRFAEKWDVLNGSEFLTMRNRYFTENAKLSQQITPYGDNPLSDFIIPSNLSSEEEIANAGKGTNWLDEVLRTGVVQRHNLTLSGGTEKTKYLVSLNRFKNTGVLKGNSFQRTSGRVNLDQSIGKYFKAGITATFTHEKHDNVPIGPGGNTSAGVLRGAIEFNPTVKVQNEDKSYPLNPLRTYIPNPVSLLEINDESMINRLLAMSYVEYSPFQELKVRANFGVDLYSARRDTYLPKSTLYGEQANGRASRGINQKEDILFDLTVNYTKTLAEKHTLSIMGGYSYQEFNFDGFNASNNNFLIDDFLWYDLGSGQADRPLVVSNGGKDLMASYFGRANYNFNNKYLFTTTIRADGASNFAENKKWGYFPSMALGWVISNEKFMEPFSEKLSNLKLRATYGQTGNNNIGNKSLPAYTTGRAYWFGDQISTGIFASQLGNPDLTWETSTEVNLGFDFGFFNQSLRGTVDVYKREISNLLFEKDLLSYNEVNTIAYNSGKTQSKGIEANLGANLFRNKDFNWELDFNFSLYRDTWKERDDDWKPKIYNAENEALRPEYSYLSDGLIQPGEVVPHMTGALPGTIKIKDINGFLTDDEGRAVVDENGKFKYLGRPDGKLDDADKVLLGTKDPGYTLSLNNTFRYKNFDLNLYFYGLFDRFLIDETRGYYEAGSYVIGEGANVFKTVLDGWYSGNTDSTVPSIFQGLSSFGNGDYYYEDAWFVRLQHITLGYNLPIALTKKLGVSSFRLNADAQNLFVFTPYKGLDPETDSLAGYPNQKTITLGLSVSF
ncbi:TonB-dependent receptor [Zobellia uliginosa]|uniref:TonB-dependent receptor n=1 Tax=Zobellia uliginosa TaxID=143224 RepID=UPI0026E3297D|nr:TonB-dependent receptor [Zobellia uliginosa]MDO6518104.1 TonB-dependent receptor [Zobellia uliginosa]